MAFDRPKDFKMDLSKSMEVLSIHDDLLRDNPKMYLEVQKFKTQVLFNQDPDRTATSYHVAKGHNVHATFEKLKREVLDIHFFYQFEKKLQIVPVTTYEFRTQSIKCTTKGPFSRKVNFTLKLADQPASCAFPDRPRQKYIRMTIGKAIPDSEKLKESFNQFMNSGGLLIEFITDTLWPIFHKLDRQNALESRKEQDERKSEERSNKGSFNFVPRSSTGKDRVSRPFSMKKSDNRRVGKAQDRSNDGQSERIRGDPIPRLNNMTRNTKPPKMPPPVILPLLNNLFGPPLLAGDARRVGGTFGPGKYDRNNSSSFFANGSQNRQNGQQDTHVKRGNSRRRNVGEGQVSYGSDNTNWRKNNET